ncbi:hypothetical protein DRP77_03290 [Candidatus Poribacteria bacterium]|nr:MAG: hypothetical protein DRP77_03290 [Candidatus Poribacteria bacterium]
MTVSGAIPQELIKEISTIRGNITELLSSLRKLNKYLIDPANNLKGISTEISKLERILPKLRIDREISSEVSGLIERVRSSYQEWVEELEGKLGGELEELLREKGFSLKGHYPELRTSFYTIELDFEKGEANIWFGPKQEWMGKARLNPREIANKLFKIHEAVTGRKFDDDSFLSKLIDAYRGTILRRGLKEGENAPIIEVLAEMAFLMQDRKFLTDPRRENYRSYGRAFFSYDLYRLKTRSKDGMELNLTVASRRYTRKRSDFLWIPTDENGNGSYFSHIRFRRVM